MLTIFSYQALRLLRGKTLLVWTLGFLIVLSFVFMVQFFNLDETYEANPMSFEIVQDKAYQAAPGLSTLVERISADDATPHLITRVTHSTASEVEAAAKRGNTNGYPTAENNEPVLHVTQKGDAQESPRILWVVIDSHVQTRAEHEVLIEAETPPEQAASLQIGHDFTQSVSVTPVPVGPATRYYFALLAFAGGMDTTTAMIAVQSIMAISPLGVQQVMVGSPWQKMFMAVLTALQVCVLAYLLTAFAFIAMVVGVDFGPHLPLCLVAIGMVSLMSNATSATLETPGKLGVGMVSAIICLLLLFTGLYGPETRSLAGSVERSTSLLVQVNPL